MVKMFNRTGIIKDSSLEVVFEVGQIVPGYKYVFVHDQKVYRLLFKSDTLIFGQHGEDQISNAVCNYLLKYGKAVAPTDEELGVKYYVLEDLPKMSIQSKTTFVDVEFEVSIGSGLLVFTLIKDRKIAKELGYDK